jgi:hypothetical protein
MSVWSPVVTVVVVTAAMGSAEEGEVELSEGRKRGANDDDIHLNKINNCHPRNP